MMCTTLQNSTVFAIILKELYSSASTVYPQHAFAPADNQQKYSEISLEKCPYHSQLSFVYTDLCQIVFASIWLIISCWIISKHFKMYITINDIKGEKTIDLSYPIRNFGSSKEITVISMLSENTQYEMTKPLKLKLVDGSEKEVLSKTYMSRELNAFVEGKHIISDLDNDPQIIKTKKLAKVTNMSLKLDELDNTNNLEDGHPSNILFTCYMPGSEGFMHFEPATPRYKKLKYGEIVSLMLKITDQNNNIITNGLGTTVVFKFNN